PVVSIQMPPAPNERDFYEEALVGMGGVLVTGMSITTLRHRTRILARQLEVHMLIIDEIHSILAGTFREQRIILNAIRFLANDLRIPIVCVGTHDAKQALMTDQQLADRFEDCLKEAVRMGHPAFIPAMWSLAPLTHCRVHSRRLLSRCPVCL